MADTPSSGRIACSVPAEPALADHDWRARFLSELAASSNVAASARKAGVAPALAYAARRQDPEFYRAWHEALCEGYDHLEMNLLHRLREGEVKPAAGSRRGTRLFDNATALRLLTLHREAVARQRAQRESRDAGAILDAIDAKLDRMRARSAATGSDTDRPADATQ
ncbi:MULTISPECIES: hypothetical protein [Novosphingobium]|uniref:Terminase small subunit n=1 Tax=Novosphingobium mathurense TaxID=428990 RepID=A0A1U6HF09_9SPHN|nr:MULTISPECIES: hypothetical protein [Novosphingobium]CDO36855.1 conserved hypothetical protein [Novosphingobium sp. KN65.2]SLJ94362.1 hypothetical protein SAMN06295987_102284 [Novosphingobium mathurense]